MKQNINQKIRDAISKLYTEKTRNYIALCALADIAFKFSFGNRNISTNGQELIDKIIEDLLTGNRSWDIEKYTDAYSQILYIFKNSELINLSDKFKRKEKKGIKLELISNEDAFYIKEPKDESAINNFTKNNDLPDDNEYKERCEEAMKDCKDEDCVILYLEILKLKETKNINKQLAKNLGLREDEVVAIKKRLCNYLKKSVETKLKKEEKIYVKTGS